MTVIVEDTYGRLGNHLLTLVHAMAFAAERKAMLIYVSLDPYAHYFHRFRHNLLCSYPRSLPLPLAPSLAKRLMVRGRAAWLGRAAASNPLFSRLVFGPDGERIRRHMPGRRVTDLDAFAHDSGLESVRVLALPGFHLHGPSLVAKHRESLLPWLKPHPDYHDRIETPLAKLRSRHRRVIGVHVRHEDYRTWQGGRFYYPLETYRRWMQALAAETTEASTGFFVASTEDLQGVDWGGLDVALGGGVVEDLFGLAGCDAILGPPSTFSLFSAFYGGVPLLQVEGAGEVVAQDRFRLRLGFDVDWSIYS